MLILPVLAYYFVFCFWPMYGFIIAFQDYKPVRGISRSEWLGPEMKRLYRLHGVPCEASETPRVVIPPRSGALFFASDKSIVSEPANLWAW